MSPGSCGTRKCEQVRVILITSAMSGEGKTWLATQLAMGLARAQRRTVLVDFDLRQPALDGALGLPLGRASARPCAAKATSRRWSSRPIPSISRVVTAGQLEPAGAARRWPTAASARCWSGSAGELRFRDPRQQPAVAGRRYPAGLPARRRGGALRAPRRERRGQGAGRAGDARGLRRRPRWTRSSPAASSTAAPRPCCIRRRWRTSNPPG